MDDSGARMVYGDGAMREPTTGKGRFDLISPFALDRLAHWYEAGAKKYADRNWEKGMPFNRTIDSALRHLNRWMRGDRSEDHLAAAAWNVFAMLHFEETGQAEEWNNYPCYKRGATKIQRAEPRDADKPRSEAPPKPEMERGYSIIAVDFDGCLCESKWPEIGESNTLLIERLKRRVEKGDKLILWTCREGDKLREAVEWCKSWGLEFDAVNENLPEMNALYGNDSRKIGADVYIDDKALKEVAG
jgi:hypothetical protein